MLFRRLSEHVRTQNWLAIALDLLIVVVGIFLGLQANDWNERRLEDRLAEQTLDRLHADFTVILKEAESRVADHRTNAEALEHLVLALDGDSHDPEIVRFALVNALKFSPSSRRSTTWVELLSSGRVGLVRDENLRALLSQYDERHQTARTLFAQFWEGQRIHEITLGRHLSYTMSRGRAGPFILDGDVESWDLEGMAADPEYIYALQRLLEYQVYYQYWHGRMLEGIREIIESL